MRDLLEAVHALRKRGVLSISCCVTHAVLSPPSLDRIRKAKLRELVVTNTTTPQDVELFRKCGVKYLVTTTPVLEGRSFGTNMMEAALIAVLRELEGDEP